MKNDYLPVKLEIENNRNPKIKDNNIPNDLDNDGINNVVEFLKYGTYFSGYKNISSESSYQQKVPILFLSPVFP